jgi:phospholipid-transporting ATPase
MNDSGDVISLEDLQQTNGNQNVMSDKVIEVDESHTRYEEREIELEERQQNTPTPTTPSVLTAPISAPSVDDDDDDEDEEDNEYIDSEMTNNNNDTEVDAIVGTRVQFPFEPKASTIVIVSEEVKIQEDEYLGNVDFDTVTTTTASMPTTTNAYKYLPNPLAYETSHHSPAAHHHTTPATILPCSPLTSTTETIVNAEEDDVITTDDKHRVRNAQHHDTSSISRYARVPDFSYKNLVSSLSTLTSRTDDGFLSDEEEEIEKKKDEKHSNEERQQVVFVNDLAANKKARRKLPSNYIRTTKYTIFTFIPLNLFEQFKRISNIYFLITMIITLIPGISPVLPESSILPLVFILALNALKDAVEDLGRFREDLKANRVQVQVLKDGELKKIKTSNVKIGDIVYVERDEAFPADLICLASHREDGACYVQTANLDGESNLKCKFAVRDTQNLREDPAAMATVKAKMKVEIPNPRLDKFNGSIRVKSINGQRAKRKRQPLDVDNVLMRGTVLKNTKYIYGSVIYVGEDTRLFKNLKKPKSRLSLLDKRLNLLLIILIICQQLLCGLFVGLSSFFQNKKAIRSFYVAKLNGKRANGDFVVRDWMTYFILLNLVIPMSLFTCLEFIKAFQAKLMELDNEMKIQDDKGNWISMVAKTSNLNQELSQMDVIFSDKTGTLTENVMEYKQCWVNGTYFGDDQGMLAWMKKHPKVTPNNCKKDDIGYHMYMIHEFLLGLVLNHSVIPELNDKNEIVFEGPSPDEIALLDCAKSNGYVLVQRNSSGLEVEVFGQKYFFEILTTLAFTSDRKRMSVITKTPEGKIVVYSKGADNIMFIRSDISELEQQDAERSLEVFSQQGYRTLVIARKEISQEEFDEWYRHYHKACLSTQKNKDELVEEMASAMERGFEVLGCTAIEDKLQQGVPEAIDFLRRAGFQIWMLTGDKPETGRNIAYTANLIQKNTIEIRIQEAESRRHCKKKLMIAWNFLEEHKKKNVTYALLIDSKSLVYILGHKKIENKLIEIIKYCKTAVCCRLTALQKAQIVQLVEKKCNKKGLSIGDGVNDVSMIQAASVGIGIIGREGSQAARASDYAIPRFRHLVRLLAVHGRYNYIRNSDYLHLSFYKNMIIVYCQLMFTCFNGFTGATLFDSWITSMYNTIFTILPPLISGIFEKDLPEKVLLENPELYMETKNDALFNLRTLLYWFATGLFHSAIIFFGCYFMADESSILGLEQDDRWSQGVIVITTAVTVIMIRHSMELKNWTVITHVAMWASWLSYIAFIVLYALIKTLFGVSTFYWMTFVMMRNVKTFLIMMLLTVACILPPFAFKYIKRYTFPSPWEAALLKHAANKSKRRQEKREAKKNNVTCPPTPT